MESAKTDIKLVGSVKAVGVGAVAVVVGIDVVDGATDESIVEIDFRLIWFVGTIAIVGCVDNLHNA